MAGSRAAAAAALRCRWSPSVVMEWRTGRLCMGVEGERGAAAAAGRRRCRTVGLAGERPCLSLGPVRLSPRCPAVLFCRPRLRLRAGQRRLLSSVSRPAEPLLHPGRRCASLRRSVCLPAEYLLSCASPHAHSHALSSAPPANPARPMRLTTRLLSVCADAEQRSVLLWTLPTTTQTPDTFTTPMPYSQPFTLAHPRRLTLRSGKEGRRRKLMAERRRGDHSSPGIAPD